MDGWLVADKPAGPTSHDVVAHARRSLSFRKIGHSGTLDPAATGVMVLALGKATRLIPFLDGHKTYLAQVRFGSTTDTLDATGQTLERFSTDHLTPSGLQATLADFRGTIQQVPPMVSAVHHEGKRLYDLARRGITVARAARTVTVDHLCLVTWEPPLATLEVGCSAGTYIRTLADDWGRASGSGAHLASLRRTEAHGLTVKDAVAWEALSSRPLLALDLPLAHWPRLDLDEATGRLYRMGQGVPSSDLGTFRIYVAGDFIGMGQAQAGLLQPKVTLLPALGNPIPSA